MADLVKEAHTLSHAAPEQWRAFMEALHEHAMAACVSAVQTDPGYAHVAQGRAQALLALHRTFTELEVKTAARTGNRAR